MVARATRCGGFIRSDSGRALLLHRRGFHEQHPNYVAVGCHNSFVWLRFIGQSIILSSWSLSNTIFIHYELVSMILYQYSQQYIWKFVLELVMVT